MANVEQTDHIRAERKGILGGTATTFFDWAGEILGFLTILLIVFLFANEQFNFLTNTDTLGVLYLIRGYAILATVGVVGLEHAAKRGWISFIIFGALVAVAFIFSFFPDVRDSIMNQVLSIVA